MRDYELPVRSAALIGTPDCIAIVEPYELFGPQNALLVELNGSDRLRLICPPVESPLGFSQIFVSTTGIETVFAARYGEVHGDADLTTGLLQNVREWR